VEHWGGSLQSQQGDTVFNSQGIRIAAGGGNENKIEFLDSNLNDYGTIYSAQDGTLNMENPAGGIRMEPSGDIFLNEGGNLILKNHEHGEGAPSANYAVYVDSNGFLKHTDKPGTNSAPNADMTGSGFQTFISWDATGSSDPDGDSLEFRFDWTNNGSYDTNWSTAGYKSHDYGTYNTEYTCKVQVRDGNGGTDTFTASAYTGDSDDGSYSPTDTPFQQCSIKGLRPPDGRECRLI
jgi:hypothetical protein